MQEAEKKTIQDLKMELEEKILTEFWKRKMWGKEQELQIQTSLT